MCRPEREVIIKRKRAHFFFCLGLLLLFFFVSPLWALPSEECKAFWSKQGLKKSEYLYDIKSEHKETPLGNQGYDAFQKRIQRDRCYKEWTVLIYMNADSDLTLSSYADIAEMESVGSSISVDLLVYHDSNMDTGSRYLHVAHDTASNPSQKLGPSDFKNFEDRHIKSPIVKWLPEQNSGETQTLENFLSWGLEHYPAKHIAFIIWSHGMGWVSKIGTEFDKIKNHATDHLEDPFSVLNPMASKDPPVGGPAVGEPAVSRKLSFDYTSDEDGKKFISIPELRAVLSKIRKIFLEGERLDVLGADACLMMMLEVAFELKDETRFLIASASSEANWGWPYRTILQHLVDTPYGKPENERLGQGIDAAYQWAKKIPVLYEQSYSGHPSASQMADTHAVMVALNTAEMDAPTAGSRAAGLPTLLNAFGQSLLDYIQEDPKTEGLRYDEIRSLIGKTFHFSGTSQDLYHFTCWVNALMKHKTDLRSADTLMTATRALQDAISNRIVVSRGVSPKYFELMKAGVTKGISIWLPASNEEFNEHKESFLASRLYQKSAWEKFNTFIHTKSGFQSIFGGRE